MKKKMLYRPWGNTEWLLSKMDTKKFDLIACLSTEERCTKTYKILSESNKLSNLVFFEIIDPIDTIDHTKLRNSNRNEISKIDRGSIEVHKLLEPIDKALSTIKKFISASSGNIVLDISSFPKRFFFPIVKILMKDVIVENLIITCTTPLSYTDNSLSENPQPWSHIPTFIANDPDTIYDFAHVGIGFMPLGLPQLLRDKYNTLKVKFFFPFPPGLPAYQRTWAFVNHINTSTRIDTKQIIRTDYLNISSTFDTISDFARHGANNVLFAPYGPKTMSLAMCLYASLSGSPVYYTQPTTYNPYYSSGTGISYAYLVKQRERELYTL